MTQCILAALLVFGAFLVGLGIHALREHDRSGFDSESAYQAIHALSGQVENDWKIRLRPALEAQPDRERLAGIAEQLLKTAWAGQKSAESADVADILDRSGAQREKVLYKLLYIAYQMNGPKVSASIRNDIRDLPDADRTSFRNRLFACMLDEEAALPELAVKPAGSLSGEARQAMLTQLWFSSVSNSAVQSKDIATLKKTVRDKTAQLAAYRMIAQGEITWLWQLVISNARTVILMGILLLIDMVLLFLLMRGERTWIIDFKWVIILLIVDFMLVFQLLPLGYMVIKALFPEGSFSMSTLQRLFTYSLNVEALKNTVIASFATMILGTLLAFPLAWLVGRSNLYGKRFFRSLFVLTYMVPPYVGAMAWLRLCNPNVGTVNQWLRTLFQLSDQPGPLNIYSLPGLVWVLTTFYYPYAFITISRAMEKMDPSLEEASRISGASPLKTLMTVTLPMMLPSIISGALLVFVCAASCYGIPSIIGAPGRVHTVTTRIVEYIGLEQSGMNDATALSIFLMVVALVILLVSDVLLARKQYITVSGKSVQPAIVDLRRWRIPLTVMVSLFAVVVILIPFVTIFSTSFKVDVGKSMFAQNNFTWANWTTVFGRIETVNCLKNSLVYGLVTASIGTVVACVMSYLLQRTKIRGRKLPDFLITLGSGTPSVVIALGLRMTMRGDFGVSITDTAYILIVAYLIKYMMMGMRTVVSAMSQIHVSLEECSQISGASWLRTMFRITGRLVFPSIAAGWFLIFIPSFYELSMTTLLFSSTTKTIGFQLYEYWTFTSQPQSCAMAFGILMIVVALNFLLNKLTHGDFSI